MRGMLKSKTLMEQIAPALEKVVLSSLHRAPAYEAPLLAWPLACGSAVAERTRAMEFSRGILRVEVPDAGWRAELQHLAPRYVAIINRYKVGTVSRIDFVIRRELANQ
jgi:Dna[CI] antecedent, DciA